MQVFQNDFTLTSMWQTATWAQACNLLFPRFSGRRSLLRWSQGSISAFFFSPSLGNITGITILWGSIIKCKLAYRLVLGTGRGSGLRSLKSCIVMLHKERRAQIFQARASLTQRALTELVGVSRQFPREQRQLCSDYS